MSVVPSLDEKYIKKGSCFCENTREYVRYKVKELDLFGIFFSVYVKG